MKKQSVLIILIFLFLLCESKFECVTLAEDKGDTLVRGISGITGEGRVSEQPKVSVKIIKQSENKEAEVKDGDILTHADIYALTVKPENDAYVYIFQMDTSKKRMLLFPNSNFSDQTNPLKAKSYRIPRLEKWFRLDENIGNENIILMASEKPLEKPDKILDSILEAECIKHRKMEGIRKTFPRQTESEQSCEKLLKECLRYRSMGGTRPTLPFDNLDIFIEERCFIHK